VPAGVTKPGAVLVIVAAELHVIGTIHVSAAISFASVTHRGNRFG
jgi:hypothetical protein